MLTGRYLEHMTPYVLIIIFCAILPAFLLVAFIYYKDRNHPEPLSMMVKGVWYGIMSIALTILFSALLEPFQTTIFNGNGVLKGIYTAFYNAALPEETAKLIMLWLLLKNNPYFDERFDGIVYAVCVGMGFAGIENIQYLFASGDAFLGTAVTRAIFAVPGHYAFAVMMGFFYSLVHFDKEKYGKYKWLIWFVPFMMHGIYDSICFAMEALPGAANIIAIGLYYFCYKMQKICMNRIELIQTQDKNIEDIKIFTEAMKRNIDNNY